SRLGLRALALPEELGGAGADSLTCCIVTEELAAGDPDLAAVLAQTATLAHALFARRMAPAHRERFLPAFLSAARYHPALAQPGPDRDPTIGIDYHRPRTDDARFKTTAARSGDAWVVNGAKEQVANAPLAKLFAVEVSLSLERGKDREASGTILISRDTPGLSVRESGKRWRHGSDGDVTFADG